MKANKLYAEKGLFRGETLVENLGRGIACRV